MNRLTALESQSVSLPLTTDQAGALSALGRELASKKQYWAEADDVAHERTLVRCSPTGGGLYSVTVDNAIGTIGIDRIQITVLPKIGLIHFLHLLSCVQPLPRTVQKWISAETSDDLAQVVAAWFLNALFSLLRGDLLRDYREVEDRVAFVRGSIDLQATSGVYYSGALDLVCRFDEFDQDTPLNRVLKAGAQRVLGTPALQSSLKTRARRALARFIDVATVKPSDLEIETDRRTRAYSECLLFAKWLLRFQGLALSEGSTRAYCFLFPTASIAEDALRSVLQHGLRDICNVKKYGRALKGSMLTVNPDLIFERMDALGDIKYKLSLDQWNRADLYQAVAFATAFAFKRASIVSFADNNVCPGPTAIFNDVAVSNIVWRIGPGVEPLESERRFVEDTRAWLLRDSALQT